MEDNNYRYEFTLENPEKYQYTQYTGRSFIKKYQASRIGKIRKIKGKLGLDDSQIKKKLKKVLKSNSSQGIDTILKNSKVIRTQDLLLKFLYLDYSKESSLDLLEKFLKKFEVYKRIFSKYDSTFKKKSKDYSNMGNYVLLSSSFALAYKKSRDVRFLNVLLKINDLLCGSLEEITKNYLLLVYFSLKEEETAIIKLIKKNIENEA